MNAATPQADSAIQPTRQENYPEWYQQVVKAADLAENSPVRGCMVIKPWGYAIWENIQKTLDRRFKETGHVNAYFPLFIPMRYLQKEADHVEGFAKECAVVTHHRLEPGPDGKLVPAGELEEPLIVRPTSETIIGEMYAKWVQSYRDLPILINQWANVVRWEMRPRIFLRTAEFLWQEGHTAHATAAEALAETRQMLNVYAEFVENYLAMPVVRGEKTPDERFPGADHTFAIEAMMQDRKALQAGTSHFLGQNFAKAQGIKFLSAQGSEEFAWTTSWGVSTRLIGGMIMSHADDNGLVCPPMIAPKHIVLLPIARKDNDMAAVLEQCQQLAQELADQQFGDGPIQVEIDRRDLRGGEKTWYHVKRGVPLRVELGPRDIEQGVVTLFRRDQGPRDKHTLPRAEFVATAAQILTEMQSALFQAALQRREEHTRPITSLDEFQEYFTPQNADQPEIHGGFALCHWAPADTAKGSASPLTQALEFLKGLQVTPRCLPLELPEEPGTCLFTGQPTTRRVLFAKSY